MAFTRIHGKHFTALLRLQVVAKSSIKRRYTEAGTLNYRMESQILPLRSLTLHRPGEERELGITHKKRIKVFIQCTVTALQVTAGREACSAGSEGLHSKRLAWVVTSWPLSLPSTPECVSISFLAIY